MRNFSLNANEIEKLCQRYEKLKAERATFEQHWQECGEYIIPRKSDIIAKKQPGEKKNHKVFDSTAIQANEIFAASLHGMLVNYSSPWFKMESEEDELNEMDDVRQWYSDVTKIMHQFIHHPSANFTSQVDEVFLDIGAFGTGCLVVNPDPITGIAFDSWSVNEFYVQENYKGTVDQIYRLHEFTIEQIIEKFPEGNLPAWLIKKSAEDPYCKHEVLHCIMPRRVYDPKRADKMNKPIASFFIFKETNELLDEEGYDSFPAMVARWRKDSNELYGRGPGMVALDDIKMLNAIQLAIIKATELLLNPPLDIPNDSYVGKIKMFPGGLNYRNRMIGNEKIEPLLQIGNIPVSQKEADSLRASIRNAFYIDQLQLAEGPDMTAYEVAQRTNEKLRLRSPMLGRIQSELFGPTIDRVFAILQDQRRFPPAPRVLKDTNTRTRYLSQLAQAQASTDIDNMSRTLQFAAPLMQIDPSVAAIFNMKKSARISARVLGYPVEGLNTEEETDGILKGQAEAAAAAQKREDVTRASEATSNIASAEAQKQRSTVRA